MGWDVPWYSVQGSADVLLAGRSFAVGPLVSYLRDGDRVFETYWTRGGGLEVMAPSYGLMDRTVYGRQEPWEDSPAGWPQMFAPDSSQWRTDARGSGAGWPAGRPTSQMGAAGGRAIRRPPTPTMTQLRLELGDRGESPPRNAHRGLG
jgi:hypothetical protein